MNRNVSKIRERLRAAVHKPDEIISGVVLPGSFDSEANTIAVQPGGNSPAVEGVRLCALTYSEQAMILVPADNSHVVIASIDGPGEWVVLSASQLTRAFIRIGNVAYDMDDTQLHISNNDVGISLSDAAIRLNTGSESLYDLLHDLLDAIKAITVSTAAGTSSVPVNISAFDSLLTRLENLLTH